MEIGTRKIIHVDMDCFYAAVEIRDNPALRGKPVAVGGRAENRGVLTTASYEARKFGLRSAMPTATAVRLCPDLILVSPHFDKYRVESQKARAIFARYTEKIEPLSLDEAYLDVTESPAFNGVASKIALDIRKNIYQETKLTASAGIAPNKFLAKVASDWKKPNGQFTITPEMVPDFVKKLKVEKIPGVGKVTAAKMHDHGVFSCEDLQKWSAERLQSHFGVWGVRLYKICRGIDEREVSADGERKSLTVETTFNRDLTTIEDCLKEIPELFDDFKRRLDKCEATEFIKSLVVKIKFQDFKQTTLESSQVRVPSIEAFSKMAAAAIARRDMPVRLMGIGVRLTTTKPAAKAASPQLELEGLGTAETENESAEPDH